MIIFDNFDPTGCSMSEKYDGVNAEWDGESLTSRDGNRFDAPEWFVAGLPSTPLVGELWVDRGAFEDVCSIVRTKDAGARWADVRYMVFEGATEGLGSYAFAVEQRPCHSADELQAFYREILAIGGEGVVVRDAQGICHKLKPVDDDDAEVIGYKEGAGRNAGRLGALVVRDREGREFRIGTGISDEVRNAPPKVGDVVRFTYQGRTKRGIPRFAAFAGVRAEQTLDFALANDPPAQKRATFDNLEATRQRVLIDGLACLPGQLDLF